MLAVLSPSKTLASAGDMPSLPAAVKATQPLFLNQSIQLISLLRKYSSRDIKSLMGISDKLAELNMQRYKDFTIPFTSKNASPALLTFRGDVYEPIETARFTASHWQYAQSHLRILSGLYGLLRPCDLMQPYRLEMGITLKNARGKNLYDFWQELLTAELNKAVAATGQSVLINLASEEYFKAVQTQALKGKLVNIVFKERQKDTLKIVGLHAKKARGAMASWMIIKQLKKPESLKEFEGFGYQFEPALSDAGNWIFAR